MPESRIDELRTIDPVLTTIAREYSNNTFIAENLFPRVTVSKLKGKFQFSEKMHSRSEKLKEP